MKSNFFILAILSVFSLLLFSCEKINFINNDTVPLNVNINTLTLDYESGGIIQNGSNNQSSSMEEVQVGESIIPLNDGYSLRASLTYENESIILGDSKINYKSGNKAASRPLPNGFTYFVLVYNTNTGDFVGSKGFVVGQATDFKGLGLKTDVSYTFIAYSLNDNTSISDLSRLLGPEDGVLVDSYLTLTGVNDFLFCRTTKTFTDNATNSLDLEFRPQFNEFKVLVNSSSTGYDINNLQASLETSNSVVKMNFSDNFIQRTSGAKVSKNLTFDNWNTKEKTSLPTIMSVNSGEQVLTITSLKIGDIESSNIKPFSSLTLEPGKKYNLNLTVTSNDTLARCADNWTGYGCVTINGNTWMRYNLFPSSVSNPDMINGSIYGSVYQFGKNEPFINGMGFPIHDSWENSILSNLDEAYKPWNAAVGNNANEWDDNAIKGLDDPCPTGFRIPTKAETEKLIADTKVTNVYNNGVFQGVALVSKRNANVKLTIPAQGYYPVNETLTNYTTRQDAGVAAYFWTSYFQRNQIRAGLFKANANRVEFYMQPAVINNTGKPLLEGYPVRCIKKP